MIVLAPAAMAARKGASSTRSRCARSLVTVGRSRCESVLVSPWPGKMFRGGEAAVFLDAAHERGDEFGDARGIFAKRARVDDRIFGIAVDVGIGRENPGNANGSRFERRDFSHRVGVFRAARGGDGHGVGKRSAFFDAHGRAALEIRANQQRNLRVALQRVDQDRGRVDLAACHAERRALRLDRERADVLFLDIAAEDPCSLGSRWKGTSRRPTRRRVARSFHRATSA